jgi:hypothetical protein
MSRTPAGRLARLKVEHAAWTIRATAADSPDEPAFTAEGPGSIIQVRTLDELEVGLNLRTQRNAGRSAPALCVREVTVADPPDRAADDGCAAIPPSQAPGMHQTARIEQ